MKPTIKTVFVLVALLLATVITTRLAQADDNDPTLKITKAGDGNATNPSSPAGINCGDTCQVNFTIDSRITLTATIATGSTFKSWGGVCKGTAPTCTVTMKEAQTATAIIALLPMTLNIAKTGTGTGLIASVPSGIDCGATCNGIYDWGTQVTLTATPATGSTFQGWSDACTGTVTTCTVTMDQAQNVTADFAPMQMTLTTAKTGSGTGAITSSPAGIDCGVSCSGIYDWSTPVTLAATPATGSTFNG